MSKKHVANGKTGESYDVALTPAEEAEIFSNLPVPPLPENTPTRMEDIERALIAKGVLSPADIVAAKKDR